MQIIQLAMYLSSKSNHNDDLMMKKKIIEASRVGIYLLILISIKSEMAVSPMAIMHKTSKYIQQTNKNVSFF